MSPRSTPKVAYKPGPAKGTRPLLADLQITRAEHMLRTAEVLIDRGIEPTLRALAAESKHLTLGFLNANSKLLAPARNRWRVLHGQLGLASSSSKKVDDQPDTLIDPLVLAEARLERARAELEAERRAHAQTKDELRKAQHTMRLLLLEGAED